MNRHCHVDMTQVETQIAAAVAALKPYAEKNGSIGAQARMAIAVDCAFSRQLSEEINRGTPVDLVSDALAAVYCNMVVAMIESALGSGLPMEEVGPYINGQLLKTSQFMMRRLRGETEEI